MSLGGDAVRAAFATLPSRDQQVLRAVAVDGRPLTEVADEIGVPAISVAALAQRARGQLREAILASANTAASAGCRAHRPRLGRYIGGELSERDARVVEDHLALCDECHDVVEALRDELGALRAALAHEPAAVAAPAASATAVLPVAPALHRVDRDAAHDDDDRRRGLATLFGSTRALFGLIAAAVLVVAAATAGIATVMGDDGDDDLVATNETTSTVGDADDNSTVTTSDEPDVDLPDGDSGSGGSGGSAGGSGSGGSGGSGGGTNPNGGAAVTTVPGGSGSTPTTKAGGSSATSTTRAPTTTSTAPTTTTTVPDTADLVVTRTAAAASSSTFEITVTIENNGPLAAASPTLEVSRQSMNPGLGLPTFRITDETVPSGWTCSGTSTNRTCDGGALSPSSTTTFVFTVRVPAGSSGVILLKATTSTPDPDAVNNESTVTWG